MKRILFFDLDGTLWNRDEQIPESACDAIRRARRNGHEVWINTGRARAFVHRAELFELGIDGAVTGAGTMVEVRHSHQEKLSARWRENRLCHYEEIPGSLALETVECLRRHRIHAVLEGRDYLYCDVEEFGEDPFVKRLARNMGERLLPVTGNEGKWAFVKLSCDIRDAVKMDEAYEWFGRRYEVFAHHENVVEFAPLGNTKGTGLLAACRIAGFAPEAAVAIGDGRNDLEMFEAAGTAVAMENGTDLAKQHADFVTARFDQDGVHEALSRLKLI